MPIITFYCDCSTSASCWLFRSVFSLSLIIKFEENEQIKVDVIQNLICLCNCECINRCRNFNQTCKSYAVIKICNQEPAFFNSFINAFVPKHFKCQFTNAMTIIPVKNIRHPCFYVAISKTAFYLTDPVNFSEKV